MAAVARAAPAPEDFALINARGEYTPEAILQGLFYASQEIDWATEFLMVNSSSQDLKAVAEDGLSYVQAEMIGLGLIQYDCFDAGGCGVDPELTDIMNVDNYLAVFYQTVISQLSPDAAEECGLAIACTRNALIEELNKVLNQYAEFADNSTSLKFDFQPIDIPAGTSACNQPRNFCVNGTFVQD
ncbi:hypothetical protein F5Y06DRAFT_302329 [Hypoxylon sp. FL0890]|nr:hypothetical protein F5Y06DRAFT_302329 [Hypoxylon sp. FL0890]